MIKEHSGIKNAALYELLRGFIRSTSHSEPHVDVLMVALLSILH
jgi:hypothetical protein